MRQVRERIERELPELNAYFQSGGLVDAVLNLPTTRLLQNWPAKFERSAASVMC